MSRLRAPRLLLGLLPWCVGAAGLLLAPSAHAYCRTYTCQAQKTCVDDELGCPVGGVPLYWPRRCLSFSVQRDASPLRGITLASAEAALDVAHSTWTSVTCDGATPSIEVVRLPSVTCGAVEFNECDQNANVWVFRDEAWPYDDGGATLAQTWVHFDTRSGEIYDADVEVNTAAYGITTSTALQRDQFIAIATHEIGHVLGLDHSLREDATMFAFYGRDSQVSDLSDDDVAGLCAIYPPDRAVGACNPEPHNGFSTECGTVECEDRGCAAAAPGPTGAAGPWWVGAALGALGLAQGRRRTGRR